jgi:hypothetical protein
MPAKNAAPLTRTLREISLEIWNDWPACRNRGTWSDHLGLYVGQHPANPYVEAMSGIDSTDLTAAFDMDQASTLVAYFLSNSTGWRGETAKRVKEELRLAVADHYAKRGVRR